MKKLNFTPQERLFFNTATQKQARKLWKLHRGSNLPNKFCAVMWCIVMGYVN